MLSPPRNSCKWELRTPSRYFSAQGLLEGMRRPCLWYMLGEKSAKRNRISERKVSRIRLKSLEMKETWLLAVFSLLDLSKKWEGDSCRLSMINEGARNVLALRDWRYVTWEGVSLPLKAWKLIHLPFLIIIHPQLPSLVLCRFLYTSFPARKP